MQEHAIQEIFEYSDNLNGVSVLFDISAGYALAREKNLPVRLLCVSEWAHILRHVAVDPIWAHSDNIDLTCPVLIGVYNGVSLYMDGHHRLLRARDEGRTTLPCYTLTAEETASIICGCEPGGEDA